MKPRVAPTATAAMAMPSISTKGSPSISIRSANVPLSPSSALQTMYFCGPAARATVAHLMPVGKPAPPRPRRPESVISVTIRSGAASAACNPARPPCASYSASDSGSITPTRAKVSRVCAAIHGSASTGPSASG